MASKCGSAFTHLILSTCVKFSLYPVLSPPLPRTNLVLWYKYIEGQSRVGGKCNINTIYVIYRFVQSTIKTQPVKGVSLIFWKWFVRPNSNIIFDCPLHNQTSPNLNCKTTTLWARGFWWSSLVVWEEETVSVQLWPVSITGGIFTSHLNKSGGGLFLSSCPNGGDSVIDDWGTLALWTDCDYRRTRQNRNHCIIDQIYSIYQL